MSTRNDIKIQHFDNFMQHIYSIILQKFFFEMSTPLILFFIQNCLYSQIFMLCCKSEPPTSYLRLTDWTTMKLCNGFGCRYSTPKHKLVYVGDWLIKTVNWSVWSGTLGCTSTPGCTGAPRVHLAYTHPNIGCH